MILPNEIASLKTDIDERVGQKIIVRGSLGRCKSFEKEATIEKTYSNLFDGTGYSPLVPPTIKNKPQRNLA